MPTPEERDDTFDEIYSIEMVEQITRIPRERILRYRQWGLITAVSSPAAPEEPRFDDATLHRLRRLAVLLSEYEVNERGLRAFATLLDEVERLREEIRFLRG